MIMNINKLTVAAFLATASIVGTLTTAATTTATPRRHGLKNSKASTNDGNNDATAAAAKMLAVQNGVDCFIQNVVDTGEPGVYFLTISKVNPDTIQFEERPGRAASIISTANFTKAFSAIFVSSKPNAAITIQRTSSGEPAPATNGQQEATLIGQLSKPVTFNNGNYTVLQYTFEQSKSQADVGSLEDFGKVTGDGTNNACSLFIDAFRPHNVALNFG